MFDLLVLNVWLFLFLFEEKKKYCQAWQQRLTSLVYLQPNNWYWHLTEWTIMKTKSSVFSTVFTLSHLFSWFINLEDRVQQRISGHFKWDELKFVVFWNDEQVCNVLKCVHCDVLSVEWEQLTVPNVSVNVLGLWQLQYVISDTPFLLLF